MKDKEYYDWALQSVYDYYHRLQTIEAENQWTNLRLQGGQFAWVLDELRMWHGFKGEQWDETMGDFA